MAHHKSVIKRVRTSGIARTRNVARRSVIRTALKRVRTAPTKEAAQEALIRAIPVIDKSAKKGVIHRNAAARYKARLTRFVNTMET